MAIIVQCIRCGRDMKQYPSAKKVYCSKICQNEDYKTRFSGDNNPNFKGRRITCKVCSKEISGSKKVKRRPSGKMPEYCSKKCRGIDMRGDGNPFFGRIHSEETKTHLSAVWVKDRHINNPHKYTTEERILIGERVKKRWSLYNEEQQEAVRKQLLKATQMQQFMNGPTKIEKWLYSALTELEIPFYPQSEIDRFVADVLAFGNVVIETFGDYWHGNRNIFTDPDARQRRQIGIDTFRRRKLRELGYKVIWIWEDDIKSHPEKVMNQLRELKILHTLRPIGVCMAGGDEFDPYKD